MKGIYIQWNMKLKQIISFYNVQNQLSPSHITRQRRGGKSSNYILSFQNFSPSNNETLALSMRL